MKSIGYVLMLVILSSCASLSPGGVEISEPVSDEKDEAVTRMRAMEFEGNYSDIVKTGELYLEKEIGGESEAAVRLLMGEAYLKLGNPGAVGALIVPVIDSGLPGAYKFDAFLLRGRAELARGRTEKAVRSVIESGRLDVGGERRSKAARFLQNSEIEMTAAGLRSLVDEYGYSSLILEFLKAQMESAVLSGDGEYETVVNDIMRPAERDTLGTTESAGLTYPALSDTFRIGVICPLSGRFAPLGEAFVKGASIALKEARMRGLKRVHLIIGDTKARPLEAQAVTKRMIHEENVDAILGAVSSSSTIAAAQVAEYYGTVMFSPVASERGINEIGEYIFQEPVDDETEIIAAAKVACGDLGIEKIAFLAPDNAASRRIERIFRSEVEKSGGALVVSDYYKEGETDFKGNIIRIKKAAPEALFIPAGEDDLVLILPQLSFYEFGVQLLGLSSWDSDNLIHMVGKDMPGAVFPAEVTPIRNRQTYLAASVLVDEPKEDANHFEVGGYMGAFRIMNLLSEGKSGKPLRGLLEETLNNRIHPYIESARSEGIPFYTVRRSKKEYFLSHKLTSRR